MAEALVGGAVLSAFLQVTFDRVASREVLDYLKGRQLIDGLVQKLKIELISADAVLSDAEEKQVTNPAVKEWLDELQDAAYDADDLLDEIATEALRCKLEAESQTGTSKVRNFFATSVSSFDKGIQSELVKILERLKDITEKKNDLGLKEVAGGVALSSPRLTTSCPENVFGRTTDKEAIFKLWQSDDASRDGICVVPIVGMGGIGKTTLAQCLYNDSLVNESFDLKAWVHVSVHFNSFRILQTILEEVTFSTCDIKNLNSLQTKIRETLTGKKFFLVLDDVWNENYNDWYELLKVFNCGAKDVKIIVTTRNKNVALNVGTVPTYHFLKELSNDDCWDLFAQHAFGNRKPSEFPHLEVIGKKIVEKCRGLPLAAKRVGGSLRSKLNVTHWNKILKNHIWDLQEAKSNIFQTLKLSYHYLPSHLKRCFSYCSIFPRGYEFKQEELILLWMAEGLLQQHKEDGSMELEEIGEEYFNDLVSRSFFQPSNEPETLFVMHDLINDLAKSISGKFCFRLENDESNITRKTRHLSYYKTEFDASKKFEIPYEAKGLRTFLGEECLSFRWHEYNNIRKMMDNLLGTFKCLRVLSLSCSMYGREMCIRELPVSIGILKHLRYLNICGTEIKQLPSSLCSLYNLQTLILSSYVTELPINMGGLINLRHLDNTRTKLKEMPPQMGRLRNLRKLSVFVVSKHGGSSARELGELQHLSGKLSISHLENVHCTKDATEVITLKNMQDLSALELKWKPCHDTKDSEIERNVLEQLCPHTNLKSLTIEYYEGTRFPNWLGDSSFSKMVSIVLRSCKNCFSLPPLGQLPLLKKLQIERFKGVCVGHEFYRIDSSMIKPFRSLEYLRFADMPEWQEWVIFEGEVFSCLRELCIQFCPKLSGGLPNHLPSLIKLEISGCDQLVASLPRAPALLGLECDGKIQLASGHYYPSLESLKIEGGCDSLWSLPLDFFPKLKSIQMHKCENLESLSTSEGSHLDLTSLTYLRIRNCPNFVSFPNGGLPAQKLTEIDVYNCKKLKSLPEGMHTFLPSLVNLRLDMCPELESFPEGGLPSNLKTLEIYDCDKLISGRMEGGLQGLHSLREFYITSKCEEVEYFPKEALMPSTFTTFSIKDFPKLKSLNGNWFQKLTSLVTLQLYNCLDLESFPKGGLPSNLVTLEILNCDKLISRRMEWGLQGLHSLRELGIGSECEVVESFPEEAFLPPTLTDFTCKGFRNLKSLNGRAFQHLTSLKSLTFWQCGNLQCLPDEGLPTSLSTLKIIHCPLLKERCEKDKGEDWLKIAHIPRIHIDLKVIR